MRSDKVEPEARAGSQILFLRHIVVHFAGKCSSTGAGSIQNSGDRERDRYHGAIQDARALAKGEVHGDDGLYPFAEADEAEHLMATADTAFVEDDEVQAGQLIGYPSWSIPARNAPSFTPSTKSCTSPQG